MGSQRLVLPPRRDGDDRGALRREPLRRGERHRGDAEEADAAASDARAGGSEAHRVIEDEEVRERATDVKKMKKMNTRLTSQRPSKKSSRLRTYRQPRLLAYLSLSLSSLKPHQKVSLTRSRDHELRSFARGRRDDREAGSAKAWHRHHRCRSSPIFNALQQAALPPPPRRVYHRQERAQQVVRSGSCRGRGMGRFKRGRVVLGKRGRRAVSFSCFRSLSLSLKCSRALSLSTSLSSLPCLVLFPVFTLAHTGPTATHLTTLTEKTRTTTRSTGEFFLSFL